MTCEKAKELKKIEKILNKKHSFDEWSEINEVVEEICFSIATCDKKCGNKDCQGLQETL